MDQIPTSLPVLPIRNAVLFPGISMPLVVGRGRSIRALENAQERDVPIVVVAQKTLTTGDPEVSDLYDVGTLCKIETTAVAEGGGRQVVVTGVARYRVLEYSMEKVHASGASATAGSGTSNARGGTSGTDDKEPTSSEEVSSNARAQASEFLSARGETVSDVYEGSVRNEALFYQLKELAKEVVDLLPGATEPLIRLIDRVTDPGYLTNICAAYLNLSVAQKQKLLEMVQIESRLEFLLTSMQKEKEILNMQQEIREKMTERLGRAQREALLREQLKTIRTELGEENGESHLEELEQKLRDANLPEEADKQAREELNRLKSLPPASAEYHVIRTYLEWIASLPWNKKVSGPIDLPLARKILDEDHYGLEEVKRRILQFLAVAKLKNDIHGPILCLVGPPGVGKTSLGQSIARTLGRNFIRTSLGGIRDEAEIRGHRRTYVGALPGRIIQSIKRAGSRNPVMMLDEIDKLRADFQGDPSAAMLEVLDPEQNKSFTDHYIDVPFDLSDVFFIATANVVEPIPLALKDRMEIIEVHSYTTPEKLEIAKRFLIPKLLVSHGLSKIPINMDDSVVTKVITAYTREAGVRELQRKIAALFRSAAEAVVENQTKAPEGQPAAPIDITLDRVHGWLGPEQFIPEIAERIMKPGVATGLAWTAHGGDLLFIEATAIANGKGQLILTGQLGDIMKESAQIALSLVRSMSPTYLGVPFDFTNQDVHIHVPAGSIPKDGPSAGVTVLAALASLISGKRLDPQLGMTGEITLRGAVLPVGGIREKLVAAHRGGLKKVILPKKNIQDLFHVPTEVRDQLQIIPVETIEEVIQQALGTKLPAVSVPREPAA